MQAGSSGLVVHIFNSSLISGPETLVLPALRHLGRPVHIVWLRETRAPRERNEQVQSYIEGLGLPFTRIDVRSRRDAQAIDELASFFDRSGTNESIDLVHAHDVKASWLAAKASSRSRRRPKLVTTHHGVRARSGFVVRLQEFFYSTVVARTFDRVLCVCTADVDRLRRRGLPESKLRVHLNGVTLPFVPSSERPEKQKTIREAWGVPTEGPLILGIAARLAPEKAHAFAFEVLSQVKDVDYLLLCFGTGPLEQRLKERASELGLDKRVKFMGHRPTLPVEMAGFDALLSFSKAEGLPINLLEAGWAATPVFARLIDGVCDLLGASLELEKSGFPEGANAADVAQRLLSFLVSIKDNQLGDVLQARVQAKFSEAIWLSRLNEIYAELLGL